MANIRSAAKASRQADKRQDRNRAAKTKIKGHVKSVLDAIATNDADKVRTAFKTATKELYKAASSKVIPQNRAARKVSRLALRIGKTVPAALQASSSKA